jgi:hypothetical protein
MKTVTILNPIPALIVLGVLAISSVAAVAAASGFEIAGSENVRPLTIRQSLVAQPAYGADDEDCVMQTRRSVLESGQVVITRKVVCADID